MSIVLAVAPNTVQSLARVSDPTLSAGSVKISWSPPSTDGGSSITGYKVYLDSALYYDGSSEATLSEYTVTDLTIGTTYAFAVSAVNVIGESATSSISVVAATVPSKMATPTQSSSTTTSVTVAYSQV